MIAGAVLVAACGSVSQPDESDRGGSTPADASAASRLCTMEEILAYNLAVAQCTGAYTQKLCDDCNAKIDEIKQNFPELNCAASMRSETGSKKVVLSDETLQELICGTPGENPNLNGGDCTSDFMTELQILQFGCSAAKSKETCDICSSLIESFVAKFPGFHCMAMVDSSPQMITIVDVRSFRCKLTY